MFNAIILIVAGFFLLLKGADFLVGGASSLAKRLGVSSLIVGLTVVALGTSMPELVVNVFAAIQKTGGIAIGNVIGSNIANIALILGVAAIITPMRVQSSTIWKEIPFALLGVVLLFIMASDVLLDDMPANIIGRADGLILLSFLIIFLYYIFGLFKNGKSDLDDVPEMSYPKMAVMIVGGILMLVLGGRLVVDNAVLLAGMLGISSRVIGLTVVAFGTSLPELATSVVAALKNRIDLSVGNIVGSNILNIFLVLGVSTSIMPLSFSERAVVDTLVNILFTAMLFVFMFIGQRHILQRWQGFSFLALYVVYIGALFI
ncbi:sodium:proton exchanger [Parcubacteria bacterium SG8_24]|nr:MAG: sodium:proton exchanger [Parcubacteria bacterium SG8_24]